MPDEIEITPRLERLVWKELGRKTARQISEDIGITPEQVLSIKRTLLESVDVLTIQEKRTKLLVDLQDIAQRAQDDYDNAPFEFKSGILNSATGAIKAVLVELARADKADTSKIEALNELRKREIVALYVQTVDAGVEEAAAEFGIDDDRLFDIFNAHLVKAAAAREIEA